MFSCNFNSSQFFLLLLSSIPIFTLLQIRKHWKWDHDCERLSCTLKSITIQWHSTWTTIDENDHHHFHSVKIIVAHYIKNSIVPSNQSLHTNNTINNRKTSSFLPSNAIWLFSDLLLQTIFLRRHWITTNNSNTSNAEFTPFSQHNTLLPCLVFLHKTSNKIKHTYCISLLSYFPSFIQHSLQLLFRYLLFCPPR